MKQWHPYYRQLALIRPPDECYGGRLWLYAALLRREGAHTACMDAVTNLNCDKSCCLSVTAHCLVTGMALLGQGASRSYAAAVHHLIHVLNCQWASLPILGVCRLASASLFQGRRPVPSVRQHQASNTTFMTPNFWWRMSRCGSFGLCRQCRYGGLTPSLLWEPGQVGSILDATLPSYNNAIFGVFNIHSFRFSLFYLSFNVTSTISGEKIVNGGDYVVCTLPRFYSLL